jgi:pyruvate kinase
MYTKDVSTDDTVTDINEIVKHKVLYKGDFLINLAAMPIKDKGMVNTLRVSEIE